jgi:AcrR family transcriptional regulator
MSSNDNQPTNYDTIAAAALRLAGQAGWRGLSLGDIALEAGISLGEVSRCFASRYEILDGFERMIDRRMLDGAASGDIDDKPRDRVFDIIMERFDAMLPYRDGINRIVRELPFDPPSGLVLAAALPRAVSWMFAGARIDIAGPLMPLKLAALSAIYLSVVRVWLKDDNQDLSKTMAALDRGLDQAKALFGGDFGPTSPAEPTPTEGPVAETQPEPKPAVRAPREPASGKSVPRKSGAQQSDADVG